MAGTRCALRGNARPRYGPSRVGLAGALLAGALCGAPVLRAQVPSPREVLGHALGARLTTPGEVATYAESLAASSPRVRLLRYGTTPEGRPLQLLVLGRPDRISGLDGLLASHARLSDPSLPAPEASRLARSLPAVVWLSYGVHGDEGASTEAALWTAYDVARGAPESGAALDSLIVVIDPDLNPDGRARYVSWYRQVRADPPDPSPASIEHDPPWPGGRWNHYLFDLNRDWSWGTQPETRARLAQWARFDPQVHVDFHEMSYESSYFFFPARPPFNPAYPDYTRRWAEYFGRANAEAFDRRGWLYFTAEAFDLFYPGYGDSWPSLDGAIGMTYEQAGGGRAGLVVRRRDGQLLALEERASHHRVASLATIRAAARRKTDLLLEYAAFFRSGTSGAPDVLLVPSDHPEETRALVAELQTEGIRVERAARPFRVSATAYPGYRSREEFPVGTYRVPGEQSRSRLARTLLRPDVPFDSSGGGFSYDVTAWSLPYAYGVEAHMVKGALPDVFREVPTLAPTQREKAEPAAADGPVGPYGALVPPVFEAAGSLYRFLADGGRARALERRFELDGVSWPPGTVFLPAQDSLAERLRSTGLAARTHPVSSGLSSSGVDLGTEESLVLSAPRIGVLTGPGVSPPAYGEVWYLLEKLARIPFDALPLAKLSGVSLGDYDVLVLPEARTVDPDTREALGRWIRRGGTLVALGGPAARVGAELGGIELGPVDSSRVGPADSVERGLRTRAERKRDRWEESVPGDVYPLQLDGENPLAWGAGLGNEDGALFALHLSRTSFRPSPEFETVAHFPADARAVAGAVNPDRLAAVARSGWLVTRRIGDGRLVLFADDPIFRLFWRSGFQLFVNALLVGPAM